MATTILNQSWNVGASFNSGTTNYTFRLEVIQESQNIGANQSTITVNKYVKGNNGNSWYGTPCTDAFSGDVSDTITYNPAQSGGVGPMRNTEVLYHTKQFTITHNADGSKQINITTTFTNGGNSYAPKTNTQTFTATLDTIPRASTIQLSASSLNIGSTSGNITWTATSKANYYHTLTWTLGSTTQTISALNHLNNTTQSGTIAYTALLNALPASATGTLTLTLKTYSNSSKTTQIGDTQTITCAITISIKPVTTLANIVINTTPINGYAIAGYSTIGSNFTATNSYGATSMRTYFTISSGTMNTTSSTSASGTATSKTLPANSNDATVTISAYTTDSRGITGATVSKSITVYGYTVPNASLSAFRTTASGTTQDSGGAYLYAVFSGSVSKSFGGANVATVTCKSTGGYSGTLTSGSHYALSTDRSATVTLTVTDTVGGEHKIVVQVPTAVFPFDMYDDGEGTVGVGLGGIAHVGKITPYLPFDDRIRTSFQNAVAMGSYGSAQSTVAGLVSEVRFSSGCAGSANITSAYTLSGVTIPTGWYNFLYVPHRDGGINGSAQGDNCDYGNLFMMGMNNANGMFRVRVSSGSIQEVAKFITSTDGIVIKGIQILHVSTSSSVANNGEVTLTKNITAVAGATTYYIATTQCNFGYVRSATLSGTTATIILHNASGASHTMNADFVVIAV